MRSLYLFLIIIFCSCIVRAENFSKDFMDETSCLGQEIVDDIFTDISLRDSTGSKGSLCDSKELNNKIARALSMVKYGKFNFPTKPDALYKGTFKANYTPYSFLKERVKGLYVLPCNNGAAAYTQKGVADINICAETAQSSSFYAAAMIHEARHIDYDDSGHVRCDHGVDKGMEDGCDSSLAQRGAYFYGLEYDILVSKYGMNFHPALRKSFRGNALYTMLNRFNKIPKLETVQYTLAVTDRNEVVYLSSDLKSYKPTLKTQLPILDSGDDAIYKDEQGNTAVFDLYTGKKKANRKYIFDFATLPLVDVQPTFPGKMEIQAGLGEQNILILLSEYYENSIRVKSFTQALPFGDGERFIRRNQCKSPKETAVYILTKRGTVYEANLQSGKIVFMPTDICNVDILDEVILGSKKLQLNLSGQLMEKSLLSSKPVVEFQHLRFKSLGTPFDFYSSLQAP